MKAYMANTRPQTRIEGATYSDYVRMQVVFAVGTVEVVGWFLNTNKSTNTQNQNQLSKESPYHILKTMLWHFQVELHLQVV